MDIRTSTRSGKCNLPSEKVFSIQIGSEIFRLSGASIASDAPSYFSRFFEDQLLQNHDAANIRTLYIDRDPTTFREIARHLQGAHLGYHVRPQDGAQFVKLFADAQFYTLPRLMSQLFESECFIQIGDRHFQIPRDIFSAPGDAPNFFTLGFAAFFASPTEVFPGLDRQGLLRPPAIVPPSVPNRSADVFDELLHMLRGYPLHIRNEDHRTSLLRDCRYFHLRGLEQKLIPHQITTNPFSHRLEIAIRLEDVRPSGIQFAFDTVAGSPAAGGIVTYKRPFVDENAADLVVEIGAESSLIHRGSMRVDFLSLSEQRIASLLQTVGKKMNLPDSHPPLGQVPIKVRIDRETDLTVDGEHDPQHLMMPRAKTETSDDGGPLAKRPRVDTDDGPWVVRTGQWRLQVHKGPTGAYEVVLVAVKLDVYTSAQVRNRSRKFL
ncbi:hypothetical protein N7447_003247 [Penicillium robsamsonii]|uniref:uncharacterized protein n=1 Tax=Penicillium robsamsonii TaxID=1792511 RepID=UPI0025484D86|nr:uncharacterized protein N7447_003247 [Penicillium robsamsonii]KAJ5826484.1 hypothetical protein N7447_003247 [Penicillium robsamsonii]